MKLFLTSSSLVCTLLIIFNNFSGLCVADDSELHVTTEDSVISDGHQPTIITVELLTIEEITKLPGKELQRRLKKKGVTCKGCSEKIDFISKVFESQELEDVVEPPPAPPIVKEGEGLDKAKIDELMADLRRHGYANDEGKIFPGSDFANLSPEDIQSKMNRGGKPPRSKAGKKRDAEAAARKKAEKVKVGKEEERTEDSTDDADGFDDDSTTASSSSSSNAKSGAKSSKSTPPKKPTVTSKAKASAKKPATPKATPKTTTKPKASTKTKTEKKEKTPPVKKQPEPVKPRHVEPADDFEETIEL